MKATFLVPPCIDNKQPAERSAGCTRVVYMAPNIYELVVASVVEKIIEGNVVYHDSIYSKESIEDFDKFLESDDSDIYFMWSVNLSIDNDITISQHIRRIRGNITIIFLGPAPTYYPSKFLLDPNVYVVRGEPEETVSELIHAICKKLPTDDIRGISRFADGKAVHNPWRPLIKNLDSIPFAARHLIKGQKYHNPKLKTGPYTTMITSRNCPFKCIYCVPSSLTFAREIEYRKNNDNRKPTIGFRSIDNVRSEIELLVRQEYKAIGFMDDNFIWNYERTRDICEILRSHNIVWGCQARVDAITEPIAYELSRSGCRYVDLGVESFNDDILSYIKKGITVADIYRAIEILKKYDIPVKLNILIGSSPLETAETVRNTLREAKKLSVDQVMFNIVSPFPGTEFYTLCKENGWLSTPDYMPTDVQRNSILNLPHLSAKEMEKLLFYNNLRYFISWRFVSRQLRRFKSFDELKFAAKALKIKLFG